jgi:outer membrane protein TolC
VRLAYRTAFFVAAALLCLTPAASWPQSLTLLEGLRIATGESRLVKIRREEERMARQDTLVARSKLLPKASASYGETFLEHQPGARFSGLVINTSEASFSTYRVAVQQILYDFGGDTSLYQAAKLAEETKRLDTRRERNAVALDFSVLYFDTLESEKKILVAKREIESLESHVQVARALFEDGVITENDLLQAEVELADARRKLLSAENLRRISGARLNSMLTRPLSTPLQVVEFTRSLTETMPSDGAADTAEKERPEMQIVEVSLKALDFEERARKSEYFPRFLAQSEYDYTKNKYLTYQNNVGIAFLMNLNLWSGGSTRAGLEKVRLAQSRLRIERARLADEIRLELERYSLDMANAAERVGVARGAIAQAEENLKITRLKYGEGVGIAVDVTDAIALLALSETNYYRALYDYYRSEAGYLYAMGKNLGEEYGGEDR